MRLVFASDSFKGTLSSADTAELLEAAARDAFPECETIAVPMADGGEGTTAALVAASGGAIVTREVEGPMGEPVTASVGLLGEGRAVIEMASAAGLPLVEGPLDPLRATTRGVGELIVAALDAGCRDLTIALGGSATNDGGMGMLAALGARFLDGRGNELHGTAAELGLVSDIDLRGLDVRLRSTRVTTMCDVDNPLVGPSGATAVFGPQKGLAQDLVTSVDDDMRHYAQVAARVLGSDWSATPGAGAAGGLGFACRAFLGASLSRGIDRVIELTGFERMLAGADACVTGEGRLDAQTARGKVVCGVARACAAHGVPCVALVGTAMPGAERLEGLSAVVETAPPGIPHEEALRRARELYAVGASKVMDIIGRMSHEVS